MEHEVVVPLPAAAVRQTLQDRELVVRCVPGLSTDAASGPGAGEETDGRLKLRVGGATITYRGSLSLIEGREGVLTAFAEGQEVRGSGEATATLRISVREHPQGSALAFTGDLSADGRIAEFDDGTLDAAGRRLLDRFAAALAVEAGAPVSAVAEAADDEAASEEVVEEPAIEEPVAEEVVAEEPAAEEAAVEEAAAAEPATEEAVAEQPAPEAEETAPEEAVAAASADEDTTADEAGEEAEAFEEAGEEAGAEEEAATEDAEEGPEATVVYLDDHAADDLDDDLSDLIAFTDDEPLPAPEPATPFDYDPEPALSGPVRRSIVGRSAEEVDHAPPHGRYAPTPPSRSARARAASRWGGAEPKLLTGGAGERSAMPWVIGGGVALLGGAVVLVRALRRR